MQNSPNAPNAQLLEAQDFDSAGSLLAEAFFDNPAHVYLFPDVAERASSLKWLLQRNLTMNAPLEHSFCVVEPGDEPGGTGTVTAMGFWHRTDAPAPSKIKLAKSGFLELPIRCGPRATKRVLEVTKGIEGARDDAIEGRTTWYLNNMVVSETLRGTGVGTQLLQAELENRVDPSHELAALATQRPENLKFYARLGFEVASERTLGTGPHAFTNWIMLREPKL